MSWFNFNTSLFNNNNNILKEPILNSTMAKNSSTSSEIHNCVDNDCSGSSFGGNNFTCALCTQPMFVSCLSDRPEIVCMLNLVTHTGKKASNMDLNSAIVSLFSNDSVFNFICLECKSRGSLSEIEKCHEDELIAEKKKSSTATNAPWIKTTTIGTLN